MEKKRKITKRQTYKFEVIHYDDDTCTMKRSNNGFSVLEVLGITTRVQNDMIALLEKSLKPMPVIRKSKNSPITHPVKIKTP